MLTHKREVCHRRAAMQAEFDVEITAGEGGHGHVQVQCIYIRYPKSEDAGYDARPVESPKLYDSQRARVILASCLTWGTTSVRMGIGGRYRATMLAVEPDCVYTTMREAPTLSAARTADDAMAYQRQYL